MAVTVVFLPYVDYQDAGNLTSALQGVDIVVSTLVPPTDTQCTTTLDRRRTGSRYGTVDFQ